MLKKKEFAIKQEDEEEFEKFIKQLSQKREIEYSSQKESEKKEDLFQIDNSEIKEKKEDSFFNNNKIPNSYRQSP